MDTMERRKILIVARNQTPAVQSVDVPPLNWFLLEDTDTSYRAMHATLENHFTGAFVLREPRY
jgi:hypothetical protein